jgi:ureidoacrylate peracid hydrolase
MNNRVLLVVDIQKEYVTKGRPFFIESIGPSIDNAKKVLSHARTLGWPIVHVKHVQKGEIFSPESPYSEYADGFRPQKGEKEFVKENFSCYSNPEFAAEMKTYYKDEIVVVGYGSTMCCLSTIIDGYHRGQKFVFVKDATCAKKGPTLSEQSLHTHATEIILPFAKVCSTHELISD